MKVLKMKNGLALVAVIVLLFVLTLLVPAMFTYANTAASVAVKGTDRQKATYLARTGVEMALAMYRTTFNDEAYNTYRQAYENLKTGSYTNNRMKMQRVWLYMYDVSPNDEVKPVPKYYSSDTDLHSGDAGNRLVGYCDVTVTYLNEIRFYDNDTEQQVTASEATQTVNDILKIKTGYTRINQSVFTFTGVSFVNGTSGRKTANIVEMKDLNEDHSITYIDQNSTDTEDLELLQWLIDKGIWSFGGSDDNQAFVRSDLATSRQEIDWEETSSATGDNTFVKQDLLVYSATGNMKYDLSGTNSSGDKLVFGIFPGLNYYGDSKNNEIDCISYRPSSADQKYLGLINLDKGQTITEAQLATRGDLNDNFVSFDCSGVLEFNADIDLRVNPGYSDPLNMPDWLVALGLPTLGDLNGRNLSLYKFLSFGAPDIVIGGSVKLMVSFYPVAGDGKRMGTLMLNAPSSTGYRYYNVDRDETVKAGMAYFLNDVTAYIIDCEENGASHIDLNPFDFEFGSNTYADKHFIKKRLFKAGDVYLFNAEVPYKDPDTGENQPGGVSLLNWYIETIYADSIVDEEAAWYEDLFDKAFSAYLTSDTTYVSDDMHYVGNLNIDNIAVPSAASSLYVVWEN